jgi:hypothetical protein
VLALLERHVPEASCQTDVGSELSFQLPVDRSDRFG